MHGYRPAPGLQAKREASCSAVVVNGLVPMIQRTPPKLGPSLVISPNILLMDEILHHLGAQNYCNS